MAEDNHYQSKEYQDLHKPIRNTTEKGACLNGRCRPSYDKVTCSYRYQGIEAAKNKEYIDIYNCSELPENYYLGTGATRPSSAIFKAIGKDGIEREIAISGKYYVIKGAKEVKMPPPVRKKDNKVYTTYEDDEWVVRKNFNFVNFTVSKVPWPNQVHHVLNHSSLKNAMDSFKNIPDVVVKGLLEEIYNINHKDNMVILPTSKHFSRLTGLPMHGSHPAYSDLVFAEVIDALSGYEQLDEDAENEDHSKPDPISVAESLYEISEDWYKKIIDTVPKNKLKPKKTLIKVNDIT